MHRTASHGKNYLAKVSRIMRLRNSFLNPQWKANSSKESKSKEDKDRGSVLYPLSPRTRGLAFSIRSFQPLIAPSSWEKDSIQRENYKREYYKGQERESVYSYEDSFFSFLKMWKYLFLLWRSNDGLKGNILLPGGQYIPLFLFFYYPFGRTLRT